MPTDEFSEFLDTHSDFGVEGGFDPTPSWTECAPQSPTQGSTVEDDNNGFAHSRPMLTHSTHTPTCNLPQTDDGEDFAQSRRTPEHSPHTPQCRLPPTDRRPRSSRPSEHLEDGSEGLVAFPGNGPILKYAESIAADLDYINNNPVAGQHYQISNGLGIFMDEVEYPQGFYQNHFQDQYANFADTQYHPTSQGSSTVNGLFNAGQFNEEQFNEEQFNGMLTSLPTQYQDDGLHFINPLMPVPESNWDAYALVEQEPQAVQPIWNTETGDQFDMPAELIHSASLQQPQTNEYPRLTKHPGTYAYPDPQESATPHPYYGNSQLILETNTYPEPQEVVPIDPNHSNGRARVISNTSISVETSELADESRTHKRKFSTTSDAEEYMPPRRRQKRSMSFSSSSSSMKPPLSDPIKQTVFKAGEKPKKSTDKSWVRCNNATRGETTRTARINQYTAGYIEHDLPHGDWQSSHFEFEYAQAHGLHFFKDPNMSGRQVHEYITQYPDDNLRIWIQVTPADSNRRYGSGTHAQCIFRDCPNKTYINKGTISIGHYRVAFDEKSKFYTNSTVDPFDCVGFAHLYCMERFLDFPTICNVANVKVDGRLNMRKESKGESPFAFARRHIHEKGVAEKFVRAAKAGDVRMTSQFNSYPPHLNWKGLPKDYENTLNSIMTCAYIQSQAPSLQRQTVSRNPNPGSQYIHHGDLEVANCDSKVQDLAAYRKAKRKGQEAAFDKSAHYDSFHPEINPRIAEFLALRAKFEAQAGTAPKRKRRAPKPVVEEAAEEDEISDNDSDEESDEEERRRVTKKKKKVQSSKHQASKRKFHEVASESEDEISDDYSDGEADEYERRRPPKKNQVLRVSKRQKTHVNYADEPVDFEEVEASERKPLVHGSQMYIQVPQQHQRIEDLQNMARLQSPQISPKTLVGDCNDLIEATSPPADLLQTPRFKDDMAYDPNLADLLGEQLSRRKSSVGPTWGILKSPDLRSEGRRLTRGVLKAASFNKHPVSSSQEFNANDPPEAVREAAPASQGDNVRRSSRLASKSV